MVPYLGEVRLSPLYEVRYFSHAELWHVALPLKSVLVWGIWIFPLQTQTLWSFCIISVYNFYLLADMTYRSEMLQKIEAMFRLGITRVWLHVSTLMVSSGIFNEVKLTYMWSHSNICFCCPVAAGGPVSDEKEKREIIFWRFIQKFK